MRYKLLASASIFALVGGWADASQITFGPSVQSITFTGDGAGNVGVTIPQLDMLAFDTIHSGLGGAWFYGFQPFTVGPEVGGIFASNATGTFKYIANDGDTLIEDVILTQIQDNTPQPKFFGTGVTTFISGGAAFLAAFGPVGTNDQWDFITNPLSGGFTLDALALTTDTATATVSAGEKFPLPPTSVPEPKTMYLAWAAGFGMVGLFATTRKRS